MPKIKVPDESNHLDTDLLKLGGYGGTHSNPYSVDMPRGSEDDNNNPSTKQGRASIFNAYSLYTGVGDNIFVDADIPTHSDFLMPTATNLISNPRGRVIYDWCDFAYCSFYGKIPNNRLITLRRFAQPVQDDITNNLSNPAPEIARLITWFDGDTNKLEDILGFSYGLRYKELTADIEQASVQGGGQDGVNGWMKTFAKIADPKFGNEALQGKARLGISPTHDKNKVHGPIDVIDRTQIRDRGMNFEHDFTLKFYYSIKSIDGINAKSAMVDCLSNVLAATYNNAKFWGGSRYWVGARPSKFWNDALKFEAKVIEAGLTGSFDGVIDYFKGLASKLQGNGLDTLKDIASTAFRKFAVAKFLNTIGRPSIPVMNSLLRGEPIGNWHVMIGNPMRPIVSMGNMIVDKVSITPATSELGYDDFPTEFVVSIHLKHGMPRDKAAIESMFTSGKGRTYWKPQNSDWAELRKSKLGEGKTNVSYDNTYVEAAYKEAHDFVNTPETKAEVDKLNN